MTPSNNAGGRIPPALKFPPWFFLGVIGVFIVLSSFLYGFARASKNLANAAAMSRAEVSIESEPLNPVIASLLPKDAVIQPMGTAMSLNGKSASMVSFLLDRDFFVFKDEQRLLWQQRGLAAVQQDSDRRLISIARDEKGNNRISLVAWEVPSAVRAQAAAGYSIQGTLSVLFPTDAPETVPELPLMAGAVQGATVGSTDQGRRTFTGSYSNPGIISESVAFYRQALETQGWTPLNVAAPASVVRQEQYRRQGAELVLLFSEGDMSVGESGPLEERTLVTSILTIVD